MVEDEKKIFFDEVPQQPAATVGAGPFPGLIGYEESADAAGLYNPISTIT